MEEDTTLIKFLNIALMWIIVFFVYKYTGFGYLYGILGSLVLVVFVNIIFLGLLYFLKKIFFTKKNIREENKNND